MTSLHNLMARLPRKFWVFAAVVCLFTIITLGLQPASRVGMSRFNLPHKDKVFHFLAYSGFAAMVFRSIYPFQPHRRPALSWRAAWLPVVLLPMMLGALDETLQGFAPGRSQDPYDWMTDSLAGGTIAIVGLTSRGRARSDRPRQPRPPGSGPSLRLRTGGRRERLPRGSRPPGTILMPIEG